MYGVRSSIVHGSRRMDVYNLLDAQDVLVKQ